MWLQISTRAHFKRSLMSDEFRFSPLLAGRTTLVIRLSISTISPANEGRVHRTQRRTESSHPTSKPLPVGQSSTVPVPRAPICGPNDGGRRDGIEDLEGQDSGHADVTREVMDEVKDNTQRSVVGIQPMLTRVGALPPALYRALNGHARSWHSYSQCAQLRPCLCVEVVN